jgi:hypothetical protein
MRQPGETIIVNDTCADGWINHGDGCEEGDALRWLHEHDRDPGGVSWDGEPDGRRPPPEGPQPGGPGVATFGADLRHAERWETTGDPRVNVAYSTIEGKICRTACIVIGAAVCGSVADVCAVSAVVTIGTSVFPCATAQQLCCARSGSAQIDGGHHVLDD